MNFLFKIKGRELFFVLKRGVTTFPVGKKERVDFFSSGHAPTDTDPKRILHGGPRLFPGHEVV